MAKIVNINKEIHTFEHESLKRNHPIQYYIDDNGCWITISHCLDKDGYPRIHQQKDKRMSRVIWEAANGKQIPEGMLILHSCDNPRCVNPAHLRLGTVKENIADKVLRGRVPKGSMTGAAKLTEKDVYYIRFEAQGLTSKELAETYKVKVSTIDKIRHTLKTWRHVTIDRVEYASKGAA